MRFLFVDCCISQRGKDSRTRALCNAFMDRYRELHPDDLYEVVDLQRLNLKPFNQTSLDDRDALAAVKAYDAPIFALARQFRDADRIVVGAPFWDLSFPAMLRIYIEYISAGGVTFSCDEKGIHGACKGGRLAYLTTGGDVERPNSLGVENWRQLCGQFGIPRFDYIFAGGLDLGDGREPELMAQACEQARKLAEEF